MPNEITREDEKIFLKEKIANNPLITENPYFTFSDVISHFKDGSLPLQVSDQEGTKVIDESQIEEIKKTMPWLFRIIAKPRTFIRSYEEKVPVETAKNINFKAISKLSKDSNDWYNRTLLSVKPKNIVSDVSEETLNLYENRVVVALIDKISVALRKARLQAQEELNEIDESKRRFALNNYFQYTRYSFPLLSKAEKTNVHTEDSSYREKLAEKLETIKTLENRVSQLENSEFYRTLHKLKKVQNPIQRTNILMFDYAYNQAYKLWIYLNKLHPSEDLGKELEVSDEELDSWYSLYAFLCVLVILNDMGFQVIEDEKISFNGQIVLSKPLFLIRGEDQVRVDGKYSTIQISYLYDSKNQRWDSIHFRSSFFDFEDLSRNEVEEATRKLLNDNLIPYEKGTKNTLENSTIALVDVNLDRCAEKNNYQDKVYRRFYSAGDDFSNEEENPHDIQKWGNYQSGIALLNLTDLRGNFLILERAVNRLILTHKILDTDNLEKCPICGAEAEFHKNKDNTYSCNNCGHKISINSCDNCHEKRIAWVKYGDDHFLEEEDIVQGIDKLPYYGKLNQVQRLMGEYAITSFELTQESGKWKLKTICPNCGIQLGDVSEKQEQEKKSKWHDTTKRNK